MKSGLKGRQGWQQAQIAQVKLTYCADEAMLKQFVNLRGLRG
ncbi:MAG: hypothetical protein AB1791_20220 [Chloroflexota bacterium]